MSAEVIPEATPSVAVTPPATSPVPLPADRPAGHVIVCGLGGIGMRITEQLRRAQQAVTVLEEYADRTQLEVVIGWGVSTAAAVRYLGGDPRPQRASAPRGPSSACSTTS